MLRYMLDTNTCIRAMRADTGSSLSGRFNRHAEQICISSVVLAELHHGAESSQRVADNLDEIELLVSRMQGVLDFDAAAAAHFGRIRTALKRTPIGPLDTLIAAHARSRDLVVVTSNVGVFGRVAGLVVENWL
jgi:tRNA(fMet)-specific endonuclease VapC